MAATIKVEPRSEKPSGQLHDHVNDRPGPREFHVRVIEGATETAHHVTLAPEDYNRLTGGKIPPEELIKRSFQFLLAREAKESILARFDLMEIARYFRSFERDIKRIL